MMGFASKDRPVAGPRLDTDDQRLEEGLEESFPASDPPSSASPHHERLWEQHPETD
jgi:hypothetical protein